MKIYDVSLPLHTNTLSWPGKTPPVLRATRSLSRGDHCTSHTISTDIHFGTHVDAPAHFFLDGATVDQAPLTSFYGPCRVVEFAGPLGSEIPAEILEGNRSERLLFKTRNSNLLSHSKFSTQFVALSEALARVLTQNGVRAIGIDYFSVDRFGSPDQIVHHILLEAGIMILEGLNLSEVAPGDYQLIALPLNIIGAEGSPVRAILVGVGD